METIFKKITKLHGAVFAEKNRDILVSDYIQKTEPTIEVTDSNKNNGKKIRVFCTYEMKEGVISEMIGYYNFIRIGKDSIKEDVYNGTKSDYWNFELSKSAEIDFRGLKTQEQRDKKIGDVTAEINAEFNRMLNIALSTKISRLNETLNNHITYYNNEFEVGIINALTNPNSKVFEGDFLKNDEFVALNLEYIGIVEKINGLNSIKEELERNLTEKKRNIALAVLEKEKWALKISGIENKIAIPEPVIKKTREAILKAFVYEKPYNID